MSKGLIGERGKERRTVLQDIRGKRRRDKGPRQDDGEHMTGEEVVRIVGEKQPAGAARLLRCRREKSIHLREARREINVQAAKRCGVGRRESRQIGRDVYHGGWEGIVKRGRGGEGGRKQTGVKR